MNFAEKIIDLKGATPYLPLEALELDTEQDGTSETQRFMHYATRTDELGLSPEDVEAITPEQYQQFLITGDSSVLRRQQVVAHEESNPEPLTSVEVANYEDILQRINSIIQSPTFQTSFPGDQKLIDQVAALENGFHVVSPLIEGLLTRMGGLIGAFAPQDPFLHDELFSMRIAIDTNLNALIENIKVVQDNSHNNFQIQSIEEFKHSILNNLLGFKSILSNRIENQVEEAQNETENIKIDQTEDTIRWAINSWNSKKGFGDTCSIDLAKLETAIQTLSNAFVQPNTVIQQTPFLSTYGLDQFVGEIQNTLQRLNAARAEAAITVGGINNHYQNFTQLELTQLLYILENYKSLNKRVTQRREGLEGRNI